MVNTIEKKRVVIADDSDEIRARVREIIGALSHLEIVGEASNGDDAIALINSETPDIIILDIRMPIKSGIFVLKTIKKQLAEVMVIVITNYAEKIYEEKCLQLGARYFLDKTNEFSKLKEILS